MQFCNTQNFTYLVNEPTRITNTTATILDQILTNSPNFVKEVHVTPPISTNDHCTVGLHLDFKINREAAYERKVWLLKNANFSDFRQALHNADFDKCFEGDDVNEACKNWTDTFLAVANEHVPNRVVVIRPNDSPWYSSELRTLKRKMIRAFHKHKSTRKEADWLKYKNIRNDYQKNLDNAESQYMKPLGESLVKERNSKTWWQTAKWLLGRGGDTSYPPLTVENKQINLNKDKAEAFNKFFLAHSDIDETNAQIPDDDDFPQGLENIIASEEEVYDLIKCIDPSKSTGPDGVSPRLLLEAGLGIVPSLTKLINLSLSSAKVPNSWKIANVIPLFKKGEKSDTNNYRPVSLLSCVSKILERIVFKHVFNYLRDTQFISRHQSGFQPGDSTVNQLSYLYHIFSEALDKKKDVHIVFCDVRKAFDRVWHKGLLYKLKKAGICGVLLKWFTDYLTERYQQVVIRGQKSEIGIIKAGVPQGSVLGPLLFLIYMNDITNVTHCNMKLFADDTSLFIEFDNQDAAEEALNADLVNIQQWANQWLVTFSPPKTKLLTCSFKKKDQANITFNNTPIESVDNHKHLGLVLSRDLSWTMHIESIIKCVSPMIDVLKKLKYDLDRKSLETIYFSFIRPKVEYGCHIWDNCSRRDSEALESLQLDMARIVTGARKGTSHELLYKETNWQTLSERRQSLKLKNFVKIVNNETPDYLKSLLPQRIGDVRENSRHPDHYYLIEARTETFRSSFIPSSINLWNNSTWEQCSVEFIKDSMKSRGNELFNYGKRKENIKHAQMRLNCSKLNSHLYSLHVSESPACLCGHNVEDCSHYLLECPLYMIPRQKMLQSLAQHIDVQNLRLDTLLNGSEDYTFNVNCEIFKHVQLFILESERL